MVRRRWPWKKNFKKLLRVNVDQPKLKSDIEIPRLELKGGIVIAVGKILFVVFETFYIYLRIIYHNRMAKLEDAKYWNEGESSFACL